MKYIAIVYIHWLGHVILTSSVFSMMTPSLIYKKPYQTEWLNSVLRRIGNISDQPCNSEPRRQHRQRYYFKHQFEKKTNKITQNKMYANWDSEKGVGLYRWCILGPVLGPSSEAGAILFTRNCLHHLKFIFVCTCLCVGFFLFHHLGIEEVWVLADLKCVNIG